jgi:hypothetical protein
MAATMTAVPGIADGSPNRVAVRYRTGTGAEVVTTLDRVMVDDVATGLPVREFRWYQGRKHYSGWYWAATTQRMIVYESRLELARIMLADFDPAVVGIAAQPMQLSAPDGGRVRRHVPDLLLVGRDGGVTVVDVKSPHKRDDVATRQVMAWTREVAGLRGWGFEEWYEAPRHLLANVTFLAGYRRPTVIDRSLIDPVREAVGDGCTVVDVERALAGLDFRLVRPVVLHLVWRGDLVTDLTRPLGGLSPLHPASSAVAR